ncbi:MAG: DUF4342 domain-containing protein [Anaerolineales bacterium]|nr:MAG: DUF4342 domain-containing protein [Anaerolineales bacterium]
MDEGRSWVQEIQVSGSQVKKRVKGLIDEGNVRRLIVRTSDEQLLMETPLTAGVALGSVLTIFTPPLAALGAAAGLLAGVKIQVVRVADDNEV